EPAEGRAREVARHQPPRALRRRADARHRRRHQGRGAPTALRTRGPGHGDRHDLVGAARSARHGRPCARRARRAYHRRHPPCGCDGRVGHVRRHPRGRGGGMTRIGHLLKARETGILLALALVIAATTIKNPAFLFSTDGWRDLLLTPSILMLVAVGQAIVIITRNVDLSVGSVVGLSAYLTGRVFIDLPGIPWPLVFLIGLGFGALLGPVDGAPVAFAKVPSLVIALGTLYIYRGINVSWTGSDRINSSDMPREFLALGTSSLAGIPYLT